MKSLTIAAAISSLFLIAAGPAPVMNFGETLITAESPEEARIFSLPANAPRALVDQLKAVDAIRSAFDAQRTVIAAMIATATLDAEQGAGERLNEALESYRALLVDLQDAETSYLQEKDLFVTDDVTVQPGRSTAALNAGM